MFKTNRLVITIGLSNNFNLFLITNAYIIHTKVVKVRVAIMIFK